MQALYQLSYNPIQVRQILKIILKLSRVVDEKNDIFFAIGTAYLKKEG